MTPPLSKSCWQRPPSQLFRRLGLSASRRKPPTQTKNVCLDKPLPSTPCALVLRIRGTKTIQGKATETAVRLVTAGQNTQTAKRVRRSGEHATTVAKWGILHRVALLKQPEIHRLRPHTQRQDRLRRQHRQLKESAPYLIAAPSVVPTQLVGARGHLRWSRRRNQPRNHSHRQLAAGLWRGGSRGRSGRSAQGGIGRVRSESPYDLVQAGGVTTLQSLGQLSVTLRYMVFFLYNPLG